MGFLLCALKGYSLVAVDGGSMEYEGVAKQFYQTMSTLDAVILHIQRLQNPILWQFYAMSVYLSSVYKYLSLTQKWTVVYKLCDVEI